MNRSIFVVVLLLGCMLSPILADSTWFIYGYNGYTGSADTQFSSSNPTVNYSTNNIIQTRSVGDSQLTVSMVKFGELDLPENAVVTAAQLRIYANGYYNSGTFQVWQMQKDWTASTATWNTTDGSTSWETAGALGVGDRGSSTIGEASIGDNGYHTMDISTSVVQSWLDNPSTNYGLQLASVGGLGVDMTSNEITWGTSYRPSLYVEYDVVPEPASMALIVIGSLGFIANRKRK